jgi:hypothetical protein
MLPRVIRAAASAFSFQGLSAWSDGVFQVRYSKPKAPLAILTASPGIFVWGNLFLNRSLGRFASSPARICEN